MTWLAILRSRAAQYLALAGAALFTLVTFGRSQRRAGKEELANEILEDTQDRVEAGRDAVQDGRNSGLSPADRLRSNDGQW